MAITPTTASEACVLADALPEDPPEPALLGVAAGGGEAVVGAAGGVVGAAGVDAGRDAGMRVEVGEVVPELDTPVKLQAGAPVASVVHTAP